MTDLGIKPEATNQEMTYGEKAVGKTFNPSNIPDVDTSKRLFADLIDMADKAREQSTSKEAKRLFSLAISQMQIAQMCHEKAITWKD